MNVGVVVANRLVPAWQSACIRALRALDGVNVTVAASSAVRRAPLAARIAGRALAREPVACDAALPAKLDVVLDLTGAEPAREPPGGVWRFRFGARDGAENAPFVPEIARGANAVDVALVRRSGGRDEILRRGRFPVTRWHPSTLRWSLCEAAEWPARAVTALRDGSPLPLELSDPAPPRAAISAWECARFAGVLARNLAGYAAEMLLERVEWNVGFVAADARALLTEAPLHVRWLPRPSPRTFIADPFVVERDGRRVLFVEQFDYARGRGVIEALELGADDAVVRRERVIDEPAHLSYPYPVEAGGELYLVPERSAGDAPVWYRCAEFPFRWTREPFAFPFADAVDTTIFEYGGRWWALCTRASNGSTFALHAFHAPGPRGPWTAHACNPIVVDVTCARPAGRPFAVGGALYRPGQDCSQSYGGGLALARIDELTPQAYRETVVRRVDARGFGRYSKGVHTVSFTAGEIVLDGKHVMRDLRQAAWQLGRAGAALGRAVRGRNIGHTSRPD